MTTQFAEYIQHGWKICKIDPGTKGPRTLGWNLPENAVTDPTILVGAGLMHAYSGTCALDVDNLEEATIWLAGHGINLSELIQSPFSIQISSGRLNRAKLIFRMEKPLPSKSLANGAFELRCGTNKNTSAQDVLPPTIHPKTGKPYQWIGDWRRLPPLPNNLLTLWQNAVSSASGLPESAIRTFGGTIDERFMEILASSDASCGYDDWIKIGMALHHETGGSSDGLAIWDEWSSTSNKYSGLENLQSHWASFGSSENPITFDSIRRKEKASPEDFENVADLAADPLHDFFQPDTPKKPIYEFLDLAELFARPEPEWIIKGVLPEAALGVIYGQHSAGKTFTEVDLALSIALGQPWRGQPVKQGPVLIIAAEDDRGIQIRLAAGLASRGCTTAPIRVLPTAPVLTDKRNQEALLEAIKREKPPSIIFIDTLAAVTPGADENSGKEMGELIGYCHKLYKATGALIMLVHHEGKTDGRGPRGWSGLGAGFEVIWKVSGDDLQHDLEIEKVKNAAKGAVFSFRLMPVANSCIVEWI